MWSIIITILLYVFTGIVLYKCYPEIIVNVLQLILNITRVRHPQVDGGRIFVTGNTLRRKLTLQVEKMILKYTNDVPAGCYSWYTNEMLITKYSMDTEYGIDTYGIPETIKTLTNVMSHEFMHMLLCIEHGIRESILFDNLCSGAESISNNGMDDDGFTIR